MTNVIIANLGKSRFYRASPVYQYNYGMVLKLVGDNLPAAYEVDFSNDINGTTITQIGGADGVVPIPSQLFIPGKAIYCWLREHPTPESSVTTAITVIPVSSRATITDEEPTPEEQSAIDQAIAALNDAVEHVDDAVEHYPNITGGIWYVWDVDAGEYVSTGIPAQGAQGNPGVDGQDGTDGFSPTATVTQTQSGATISITDKQGTTTANITNGQDGAPGQPGTDGTDGVSPTVTVTDITGGHRITITDADGVHSFDVMDGESGAGAVQDVQVNGTSVVQDGVANVPVASSSALGVAKVNSGKGITINSNNELQIYPANEVACRNASNDKVPVTPYYQKYAVYFGLAKAAGATNTGITLGQYTDAAKSAIHEMLNGSVSVTGTTPTITALSGIRYVCGEVSTLDITLPASGIVDVVFSSGSTATVLTVTPPTGVTVKWANGFDPTALDANTTYEINIMDGLGVAATWT